MTEPEAKTTTKLNNFRLGEAVIARLDALCAVETARTGVRCSRCRAVQILINLAHAKLPRESQAPRVHSTS